MPGSVYKIVEFTLKEFQQRQHLTEIQQQDKLVETLLSKMIESCGSVVAIQSVQ